MSDDETSPSFAEVAAEDPATSVEHEHEALDAIEEAEDTSAPADGPLPDDLIDPDESGPGPSIGSATPSL